METRRAAGQWRGMCRRSSGLVTGLEVKMDKKNQQPAPARGGAGRPQTDLAEGEPDTVDESIRIHEQKKDIPSEASEKRGKK